MCLVSRKVELCAKNVHYTIGVFAFDFWSGGAGHGFAPIYGRTRLRHPSFIGITIDAVAVRRRIRALQPFTNAALSPLLRRCFSALSAVISARLTEILRDRVGVPRDVDAPPRFRLRCRRRRPDPGLPMAALQCIQWASVGRYIGLPSCYCRYITVQLYGVQYLVHFPCVFNVFFLFCACILSCGFVDYVLITYLTARMAARSEKFTKEVRDVQR